MVSCPWLPLSCTSFFLCHWRHIVLGRCCVLLTSGLHSHPVTLCFSVPLHVMSMQSSSILSGWSQDQLQNKYLKIKQLSCHYDTHIFPITILWLVSGILFYICLLNVSDLVSDLATKNVFFKKCNIERSYHDYLCQGIWAQCIEYIFFKCFES